MHISMHFSTLKTMHNESAHSQPWEEAESARVHRAHPGPQEMLSAKDILHRIFSDCGEWGLLSLVEVGWLLFVVVSLAAEHTL